MAVEMEHDLAVFVGGPLDGDRIVTGPSILMADGTAGLDPTVGFAGHYHLALDDSGDHDTYVWGHIAVQLADRDGFDGGA